MLTDGPWCPADVNAVRGLRCRTSTTPTCCESVRCESRLRVQVANAVLRGPTGALFRHGGTSTGGERYVPDQEIRFDVSPRNLNLGR